MLSPARFAIYACFLTVLSATENRISDLDRTEIQKAYQKAQHTPVAISGGYSARSLSQGWQTRFDAQGFTVQPDSGAWSWGLELKRYGFAGNERAAGAASAMTADKEKVRYRRGGLEEWFVNDPAGVEHGFTLPARPAGGSGPLRFVMDVRGNLVPQLSANGRDVVFNDAQGRSVLNYAGLKVWDASGKVLPARFEASASGTLQLAVEEAGAQYPLTVDPWIKLAYLKASNNAAGINFGSAVAISGDTVVVGAPGEDGTANNSGAAYVFVRSGNTWTQQAYLKASNAGASDNFGSAVSISGDTIVVGALNEDSNATGINGNGANNSASNSGAAYVFVRSGAVWTQQAYLKASNTNSNDNFGTAVSVSGDTILVGATGESSNATGVNGSQGNSLLTISSGAAYVFVRSEGIWSQQAYLKASNTVLAQNFGVALSISGDTAVVGSHLESGVSSGIDGNQANSLGTAGSGATYIFVRSGSTWSQQAYVKASNAGAGDNFGRSVAISGDTVIVGAPSEGSNATGVNGNQANNSALGAGAAYVFVRSGTTWSQQAYVKASNAAALNQFGANVAISGDRAIVGAAVESSNATGIGGDETNNSALLAGAAYVFQRTGTTWAQEAYVKASNTGAGDGFGSAVGISGDTIVSGAPTEDGGSAGVDGDETGNSATDSGAAYVYRFLVSDLTVRSGHDGAFTQGEGGFYSIYVSNVGNYKTIGQVAVTDALPSGLIAKALVGPGWNCILATVSCYRDDALEPGQVYPAISLAVNVAGNASLSGLTNVATVSGGGELNTANNTARDFTGIVAPAVRPAQSLTVSPSSLVFEYSPGAPALVAKTVSVGGESGLGFLAATAANWLSVTPGAGTTQGIVRVLPNANGLTAGTYSAVVLITGPNGTQYAVDVTLRVLPPPELYTAPGSLTFTYKIGDAAPVVGLYVGVRGGSVNVDYAAAPRDNWLALAKASGTTGNLANPLVVSLNVAGLTPGTYETVLRITSATAVNSPLQVPVTLTVVE